MVMNTRQLGAAAADLLATYRAERPRLKQIADYMANRVDDIYVPRSATAEYRRLVDQARFNVLPLIVNGLAQNLYIDGYRPSTPGGRLAGSINLDIWDQVWQPNRMDARQEAIWRASITYGYSYTTVLPGEMLGKSTAVVTPYSPRRLVALYDDPDNDEWPVLAACIKKPLMKDWQVWRDPLAQPDVETGATMVVYDDEARYTLTKTGGGWAVTDDIEIHNLGVVPVVRFLDSIVDEGVPPGKVEPQLPAQRQLNQTTFGLLMAQQHAAFRQRWATGMAIAEDPDGNPVEPFNAAVNRVWQNESPDGKFGDFEQTDLSGYLNSRDKLLLFMASTAQVPPHNLIVGAGISNISAEALAALEASRRLDVFQHQKSFGESAEQMLRLAGLASGDTAAWEDESAQVVWRDTTPRSLAQVADALGKLASQLEIPPRALWERVPGVTDTDLARWESMADEADAAAEIRALVFGTPEQEGTGAEPDQQPVDQGAPSAA